MTFWNDKYLNSSKDPKQKFRFVVKIGERILYNVKSVTKPTFTTEVKSYTLLNHKFKYPGVVTWEPISITFVDGVVEQGLSPQFEGVLNSMIEATGYRAPDKVPVDSRNLTAPTKASTVANSFFNSMRGIGPNNPLAIGQVKIEQQDNKGRPIDTWVIHGPLITSISFGELAYESDDLVEYKLDIEYDFATYERNQ